jgi:simple sugar transport system ATP-binding protein
LTTGSASDSGPLLRATDLCVRFGPVCALDAVDFELRAGEVRALLGENGAGKSTLIKCLSGIVRPSRGEIRVDGRVVRPTSPHEAESLGIATVFQEVGLIPHLSVTENIVLGREPVRGFWPRRIDWREARARAVAAMERLGLAGFDVGRELRSCSVAVQQMVAIARALSVNARVLILDEPTSSLDRDEAARLLDVLRELRSQGLGIVFVSHFLDQVDAIADRVTVLRDGAVVGTFEARSMSRGRLVSLMVGREFGEGTEKAVVAHESDRSVNSAVSVKGLGRAGMLESVDLEIRAAETVGLAGLLGSGRTETARLLFGAEAATRGEYRIDGVATEVAEPRAAIGRGLGFLPENRKAEGVFPALTVAENMIVGLRARAGLFAKIDRATERELVAGFIASLGIKTNGAQAPIGSLSGGNQQKVLLARWFAMTPRVLILDEPTRGIDIAAKVDVLRAVESLRERGVAVLLISSELEELVRACSRVVVLRERRSVAELSGSGVSEHALLRAMAGHHD